MAPCQRMEAPELDHLLTALREDGFRIFGPRLHNQAIVVGPIESSRDLPQGWTDEQENGRYRLRRRDDNAWFGFNSGPQSWKQFLFAPREKLWDAERTEDTFHFHPVTPPPQKTAFLGVRACDLAAIRIQDRIFLHDITPDQPYQIRRQHVFLIAVNCTQAGHTCFCVSMHTGPRVFGDYDLALTEIVDGDQHFFLCRSGSSEGERLLSRLHSAGATSSELAAEETLIAQTAASMGRTLETDGIKEMLYRTLTHPRWDDVARRCLSCANCTLVCPTCFCSTMEDVTDLSGDHAERWRRWDSCFTLDHSYLHGGHIHASVKSRYRQWMTHKLGSWIDQFGVSGCVGCGRCITWCPVGIDITEEAAALRGGQP